jgi:hypothetical protein
VRRFAPLIRAGGLVLDRAAGRGRHARLPLGGGFTVRAVNRDVSALRPLAGPRCEVKRIALESGAAWQLGDGYDRIVEGDAILNLSSIGLEMSLDTIYEDTELDAIRLREGERRSAAG